MLLTLAGVLRPILELSMLRQTGHDINRMHSAQRNIDHLRSKVENGNCKAIENFVNRYTDEEKDELHFCHLGYQLQLMLL